MGVAPSQPSWHPSRLQHAKQPYFVGPFVPHNTYGLDREENHSGLPDFVVQAPFTHQRHIDIVGLLQDSYFRDGIHLKYEYLTGTGERMTFDQMWLHT